MIKQINPDGSSFLLNDTLGNVKFSNTAWAPDNKVTHCYEVLLVLLQVLKQISARCSEQCEWPASRTCTKQ